MRPDPRRDDTPEAAATALRRFLVAHAIDPTTRLMYSSRSADKPPGQGAQEVIAPARIADFAPLGSRPHWRRQLSNFARAPFELALPEVGMRRWETVEHYFQAAKLSLADPTVAASLADTQQEGPDHLAGLAARTQRKAVLLDEATLARWDDEKSTVMERAMFAKFSSHPDLAATLAATLDAHLIHVPARSPRHGTVDRRGRFVDHSQWELMTVRARLGASVHAALSLVVLYVDDLADSCSFYEALGLSFAEEQHGTGPRHVAAELGELVLELYPAGDRPTSQVRLGFTVPSVDAAVEAARARGAVIKSAGATRATLLDPDGNRIMLTEQFPP